MILAPDANNKSTCPIWDGVNLGDLPTTPEVISEAGNRYYSSRAGGPFRLMQSGAALLALDAQLVQSGEDFLPAGQQANLSYWIYQHNLKNRLFDELTDSDCREYGSFGNWMDNRRDRVLKLDKTWVEGHLDRTPSASDRMLMFLRELIRCGDAGTKPNEDLLKAAGGCRNASDLAELQRYAVGRGWTGSNKQGSEGTSPYFINLPARIHVEEQLDKLGPERQGFVARWFDCSMDPMYEEGIAPAIWDAGYEPHLINDRGFTGGVVDQILADIRQSKFVVADFTSCGKCKACEKCKHIGARGGVYFEAGFALGLGKTVFLTCRKNRAEAVHFDVNHLNRIEWETPEDLREQLKNSIEAILGPGPRERPDNQPTDSQQPERTAT